MTKLHTQGNWYIKVFGNEHPPVHVHVHHPDGKAVIALDGTVKNRGVPTAVVAQAMIWVTDHADFIRAEWARLDNPDKR